MGLDTTHDCWHGPYSAFMRWRIWLNYFIALDHEKDDAWKDDKGQPLSYRGATRESLDYAWEHGFYDDQGVPLNVLMGHSDCDGDIAADVCARLADALEDLANRRMPRRALYDEMRPPTERFIAGLRLAASRGEPVRFH